MAVSLLTCEFHMGGGESRCGRNGRGDKSGSRGRKDCHFRDLERHTFLPDRYCCQMAVDTSLGKYYQKGKLDMLVKRRSNSVCDHVTAFLATVS